MDIETLQEIHQEILHLRDEIQNLKDNSLSVGWKAVIFGAGIPAIISAILSVIQLVK